jgi:hypothetical protein
MSHEVRSGRQLLRIVCPRVSCKHMTHGMRCYSVTSAALLEHFRESLRHVRSLYRVPVFRQKEVVIVGRVIVDGQQWAAFLQVDLTLFGERIRVMKYIVQKLQSLQ